MSYPTFATPLVPLIVSVLLGVPAFGADDPPPRDTQPVDGAIPTPAEALASLRLPEGFRATLFASEPDVRQPIAFAFDERGRLWVAENYTYAEREVGFADDLRDRIVILEDEDGDGRADKRTVFADDLSKLTSIEIGLGGVWALCAPHLVFFADGDRDDRPDGEPEIHLDGFQSDEDIRHNVVNGLRWGPDGWLWGRHGILATSLVGRPGSPSAERVPINCGMWRYHPTRRVFEAVVHGTTNPWGHDWDEHGELFFINTVIGHLWHVLPGAHYERMYGEDLRPHLYSLIPQTADHVHWDTREAWSDIRTTGVTEGTDRAGGGHAHSGLMIYLGDDWPEEYRGDVFTLNFHGRRLNRDRLERRGATYVGRHEPDLVVSDDRFFRGIDLGYGPDGGVYVLDWSDIGECHENDGVLRSTGRIFKITYEEPPRHGIEDLSASTDLELARLTLHANEWFVRQARRLLRERALEGKVAAEAHAELERILRTSESIPHRLRALWALRAIEAISEAQLLELLGDPNEHVRVWAVKLLCDAGAPSSQAAAEILERARIDSSGLVLAHIASQIERFAIGERLEIARALSSHAELAGDPVLPRLVWYGVEQAVAADARGACDLAAAARWPLLRENIARRLTSEIDTAPAAITSIFEVALRDDLPDGEIPAQDVLRGMREALRGRRRVDAPAGWTELARRLEASGREELRKTVREIALVFGDGRAIDELRALVSSPEADIETRRAAIRSLVEARDAAVEPLLYRALDERDIAVEAVRGLAALGAKDGAKVLIERFDRFRGDARDETVRALASRREWAEALVAAVESKRVPRDAIGAFELRQMQLLGSAELETRIAEVWPDLKLLDADKRDLMIELRAKLSASRLASGDRASGRKVFEDSCARCHRLFGHGGTIGPDLTGGQRHDLGWLLENIVDPSATVADSYRMSVIVLEGGRIISGVIVGPNDGPTLTVETPERRETLPRDDVIEIQPSELSLMPEGLLSSLDEATIAGLVAYLMGASDVPLPDAEAKDETSGESSTTAAESAHPTLAPR